MNKDDYRKTFSKRLQHYMKITGKKQSDIIRDLGYQSGTVSMWVNGRRLPRMDKIESLAKYFDCQPSDLYEEKIVNENNIDEMILKRYHEADFHIQKSILALLQLDPDVLDLK